MGEAVAKLWDDNKNHILKLWLIKNQSLAECINNTSEPVRFSNQVPIGILNLRSLGYFKVNNEDTISKLGEHFTFYHYAQEKHLVDIGMRCISECIHPNIWTWEQVT